MPAPTLIYETVYGSRAYGLDTAASDEDLRGVVVGPAAWYHGFVGGPEQVDLGKDHVHWEIRKLMRLLAAANPTVLEVVYTDPRHHRVLTPAGRRLLDARDLFLSRRVKDTFAGYALGQLRRIETHRRWLLHPPSEAPTRAAYGLPERSLVPRDQLGAAEALLARGRLGEHELPAGFLELLGREKRYRAARREWEQFQQWCKARNPARAELERRFGYDTKHAQHLIRLLRMALEILERGQVVVERPDRDELLAIRQGAWSYEQLLDEARRLQAAADAAAATSPLPADVDLADLDALCASIVEDVLRARAPGHP